MNYTHFLGIDIGKKTFSACLRDRSQILRDFEIENKPSAIRKFIKELEKLGFNFTMCLVCLEHTGVYTIHCLEQFYEQGFNVWVEHPTQIKRSIGMVRGKDDQIDARRISGYALRFEDKTQLWEPERSALIKLKKLFAVREKLIQSRMQLKMSIEQSDGFENKEIVALAKKHIDPVIKKITGQIEKVCIQIRELVQKDSKLKELSKIVRSVPGVGEVVSWKMLVVTNEFKSFEDGRKFACYSGIVPFDHRSGSSIKGKPRVSKMANKEMKALLHMAAIASVGKGKGEMYEYFHRKVKEGKHKMSVINAIRNKIVQRVFACVRDNKLYEYSYINSLD